MKSWNLPKYVLYLQEIITCEELKSPEICVILTRDHYVKSWNLQKYMLYLQEIITWDELKSPEMITYLYTVVGSEIFSRKYYVWFHDSDRGYWLLYLKVI